MAAQLVVRSTNERREPVVSGQDCDSVGWDSFGTGLPCTALLAVFVTTKVGDLIQEGQSYARQC